MSLPDFAYLIKAAKESVQRGDLEEADVMLDEARKQVSDQPQRQAATQALEREISQRRNGREEGILQRLLEVQECFGSGNLMRADRLLFEATEDFGQDQRFDILRQHLKALHLEDLETKIEGLMEESIRLSTERRDIEAMELIHKAQAMAPPNHQALQQRLKSTAERLQQLTSAHRRERLDGARKEVDQHLAAFDLPAARASAAAEADLVSPEAVTALRRHLKWSISQQVHATVQAATRAYETSQFGIALTHLRQALAIKPNDDWLQARLEETAAEQRAQEKDLQQDAIWLGTLASIQEAIAEHRFTNGRSELERAEARWGQGASLDDLRQRLDSACQEELRTVLKAARQCHLDGDSKAAQHHLAAASRLAPGDPSIRNLAEAFERPQPTSETTDPRPEVNALLNELKELCERTEYLEAWRRVQSAIETFGEIEPLVTLQRRVAQELVDGI